MSSRHLIAALRHLEPSDAEAWDSFVEASDNGTFLHTRRFLGYHGERFSDRSLMLLDAKEAIVGVLPAAVDPGEPTRVVSHPGLTYGGLVHSGGLRGEDTIEALRLVMAHYRGEGFTTLRYKSVPEIYHRVRSADDLYAMFRLGANRYRFDLSATVDVQGAVTPRRDRRRNLDLARRANLTIETGPEWFSRFWPVLTANLANKFGVGPAHSLAEIADLQSRFPENVICHAVLDGGEVVGGLVNFGTPQVLHCQYSAANEVGFKKCALDLAFAHAIELAREAGQRWFDFGTCNEQEGRYLNSSLYDFKLSFGAGSVPHEFFDLSLEDR